MAGKYFYLVAFLLVLRVLEYKVILEKLAEDRDASFNDGEPEFLRLMVGNRRL